MTPITAPILETETSSLCSDSALSFFEPLVKALRTEVESRINELPFESRRAIAACYRTRQKNNDAFEYGPWLIADLLGVAITNRVRSLAVTWFLVHLYTLVVDDFLDAQQSATPASVVGAGLCLQRGLTGLYGELPELASNPLVSSYFQEAAEAALLEFRDHTRASTDALYKKMAIAKVWATVLLTEQHLSHDCIEKRLEVLSLILNAMQLRDDLMDWETDFDSGHFTPLLLRSLSAIPKSRLYDRVSLSGQQMSLMLLASDAFEEHVVLSNNYFDSALTKATFSGDPAREYIRRRIAENRSALTSIRNLRTELGIGSDYALRHQAQTELRAEAGLREVIQTKWMSYGCR